MSNSEEEEIARDYICFEKPDATIIVVDSTCLERNLNLVYQIMEITTNIIVCVNLLDEAKSKKIKIDLHSLSKELGVPVVGTTARKKKTLDKLMDTLYKVCKKEITPTPLKVTYSDLIENQINSLQLVVQNEFDLNYNLSNWISLKLIDGEEKIIKSIEKNLKINLQQNQSIQDKKSKVLENLYEQNIMQNKFRDNIVSQIIHKSESICKNVCTFENENYSKRDRNIDKILTSKKFGIPIMIIFLSLIFYITIIGSNYPSQALFNIFNWLQDKLLLFAEFIHCPELISNLLIFGIFQTLTWVISVMLPPMAIFFPLFTFLEDLRIPT